ncbi:MAG: hypothetical protein NTY99_02765 [DPANN group archaeon]|nr:hypothetical protein [DPANN group archaeon]
MPKTQYSQDLKTLNSMLKEKGIALGDMVRVTRYEGLLPVCGYYAGTTECYATMNTKTVEWGDGGLEIVISPYLNKLRQHSITKPKIAHEAILIRDIKSLEKLVVSKKS